MSVEKLNLVVGFIGATAAVVGTAYLFFPKQPIIPESSRFYCALQSDSNGQEVWTVMHRHTKGTQPWLKMVSALGDDWTTKKRCMEVANRLDIFRLDGLIELSYRDDPNTPKQSVICVKTRIDGNNCPLLVTLKPGVDPYLTLRDMASALLSGEGVYQSGKGGSQISSFSPASPVIKLDSFLSAEDN